jgi:hypothetical protein
MRRGGAILAVAMALAVGAVPTPAAAISCENEIIHDYAKPLKRLPELRQPPLVGTLPFAPAQVSFGQIGRGPLITGSGKVGFYLSYSSYPDRHPSPRLNWIVAVSIAEIDGRGRTTKVIRLIEEKVKRLPASEGEPSGDLSLAARISKPGLYRVQITFSRPSGERFGSYGGYVRLLRPTLDTGISLNKTSFYPGETLVATLENRGTEALSYGLGYAIESFDGMGWGRAPISPSGPVPAIGLGTGPGEKSTCWSFQIPANAEARPYRFAWSGEATRSTLRRPHATPLARYSEFQILPAL